MTGPDPEFVVKPIQNKSLTRYYGKTYLASCRRGVAGNAQQSLLLR
ncbi:MAG: hypothetical protein P4L97_04560 [Dyella sp.]|nr:hypothetical protein [Dyella sp.]